MLTPSATAVQLSIDFSPLCIFKYSVKHSVQCRSCAVNFPPVKRRCPALSSWSCVLTAMPPPFLATSSSPSATGNFNGTQVDLGFYLGNTHSIALVHSSESMVDFYYNFWSRPVHDQQEDAKKYLFSIDAFSNCFRLLDAEAFLVCTISLGWWQFWASTSSRLLSLFFHHCNHHHPPTQECMQWYQPLWGADNFKALNQLQSASVGRLHVAPYKSGSDNLTGP